MENTDDMDTEHIEREAITDEEEIKDLVARYWEFNARYRKEYITRTALEAKIRAIYSEFKNSYKGPITFDKYLDYKLAR